MNSSNIVQRQLRKARRAAGKLKSHAEPRAAVRHFVRMVNIAARTAFWMVALHYYGSKELLYIAAAWMFALAVKDLTFWRLRLRSVRREERRARALLVSVVMEASMLAVRLAMTFALVLIIAPFSAPTAAVLAGLSLCQIFWSRETLSNLTSAYQVAPLRIHIACISALAGILGIVYCAETGRTAVEAALAGFALRELVYFVGLAMTAVAGRLGLRLPETEVDDDEEGDGPQAVTVHDGRQIRSTWKLLIADNAVWSRWKLIQFGTRYAASGLLGPFGGVAARILFAYKQPGAYVHKPERLKPWQVAAIFFATVGPVAIAVIIAAHWGLLHALGITLVGLVFRLASIIANLLLWRQLTPLVGLEGKIPFPPARLLGKKA